MDASEKISKIEDISELKRHEQMLTRILSSISCGIIQYNQVSKEIILVNPAALEILGYETKEELEKDDFNGVAGTVVPEDRERINRLVESLTEDDDLTSYEYRAIHKDGKVVHCYGSVQVFLSERGERIVQRNVMDITEKIEGAKQIQNLMSMQLHMVDSLSCGIIAYTLDDHKVFLYNKEAKRMFNHDDSKEETLGKDLYADIFKEDAETIRNITEKDLKNVGDSCNFKYRLDSKDDVLVVECSTKLLAFEDGEKFILCVLLDITEKEKMQSIITRERKQYRDAVTANSVFSLSFDVTEGVIYNDATYADGRKFSEVYGVSFPVKYNDFYKVWKKVKKPEFLTPSDQNHSNTRELIRHFEGGNSNIACEYYSPDENRYFRRVFLLSRDDITGHVMAVAVCNDITDIIREDTRKRNKLAMINRSLKKQNEITKSFSSIYFASWEVNIQNRTIFEISVPEEYHCVFEKSMGEYEDACNILIDSFMDDEYKKIMSDFLNIRTLQKRIDNESVLMCEYVNSEKEWCAATFIPSQFDKQGNVTNAIYAIRNVYAEKKKELDAKAALQQAYDAANQANAAKTDFLASMSHDIRTPMNAIIGMTAIAQTHIDDKDRVMDCLSKISISSNHLLDLINDVLDMNKIEAGKLELASEEINLSKLIESLIIMSKSLAEEKNHSLAVSMHNVKHEYVIGDRMRINQIFMNLMSNAVKYTPPGGKISVTVTEEPTNNDKVGCYELVFEDNGIGMSKEFVERMYEPFTRASDSRVDKIQGTGLGMSITKNLVSMMNGNIKVESEPGKGSRFTVTIFLKLLRDKDISKLSTGEEKGDVSLIEDLSRNDYSDKRALLVEDNELNAEIATEIIGMTGMKIEHVSNGQKAFERMQEVESGYYDVVFMDVQMPVMNGYEAARAIRKLPGEYIEKLPIIAMTANAFAEDVKAAKDAGMNEHVAKPLDLENLFVVLRKYI